MWYYISDPTFLEMSDFMNLEMNKAIRFAATAHKNQVRKTNGVPYIAHPFEVAVILVENGCEDSAIIAGILHDTIEDTSVTAQQIEEQFGQEVADIVKGCTEDKTKSWDDRKKESIEYLRKKASLEEMQVVCADKLSNLRSLYSDIKEKGDSVWQSFNSTKDQQKWYYREILEKIMALADYPMYDELEEAYKEIFG